MEVKVVNYDKNWPEKFELEKLALKDLLANELIQIFHIGSTSVENLKAKPIIDILLVVNDIEKLDSYKSGFENLGYEVMGEFGMKNRRYFRKGGDNRTHQIHAFQYDNLTEIIRHIAFRDYLRKNEQVKNEYSSLKETIANTCNNDIDKYCDDKDAFVKQHEKLAIKAYLNNL